MSNNRTGWCPPHCLGRITLNDIENSFSHADFLHTNLPTYVLLWAATRRGFCSKEQRQLWRDTIIERAISTVSGRFDEPAWESWAANWLNGTDRSAISAIAILDTSSSFTSWAARAAAEKDIAWVSFAGLELAATLAAMPYSARSAWSAVEPVEAALECERKAQISDLLAIMSRDSTHAI